MEFNKELTFEVEYNYRPSFPGRCDFKHGEFEPPEAESIEITSIKCNGFEVPDEMLTDADVEEIEEACLLKTYEAAADDAWAKVEWRREAA